MGGYQMTTIEIRGQASAEGDKKPYNIVVINQYNSDSHNLDQNQKSRLHRWGGLTKRCNMLK